LLVNGKGWDYTGEKRGKREKRKLLERKREGFFY